MIPSPPDGTVAANIRNPWLVGCMTVQLPPFFLIIADHDRGFFCVEGPMTDDRPWQDGARDARNNGRKIVCGPTGPDRDALAAEYRHAHKLAGVPPGSILRPHR